jgi:carbon-monoxide dehydrogenase large subunit
MGLPEGAELGLDGIGSFGGVESFPNGCMVCEVEIDRETGALAIDRFLAVDDVGAVINPRC